MVKKNELNNRVLIYIGNKLHLKGFNPTGIDILSEKLALKFTVVTASDEVGQLKRAFDMIKTMLKYRKIANVYLIDTYSYMGFYFALGASLLARMANKPYVPILHGGNLSQRLDKNKFLSRLLFENAAILVSPSFYLKSEFEKRGYRNIKVIPNFIDLDQFPFKRRRKLKPNILWVRAFHKMYNPNMALDVLSKVIKHYPNATLTMVGPDKDGTLKEFQNHAKLLGLSSAVTLTGKLSKNEWTALSADCDIFINTTDVDNMPYSLIEAMALGLCVISTNVGGIPFLLHDGVDSYLVNAKDSETMAKRIGDLLEDPESAENISSNGAKEANQYSWSTISTEWERLIENV